MSSQPYSIPEFADALRAIVAETTDEAAILARALPLAKRAAADRRWLLDDMYEADPDLGFGTTLLHAEADNSLFLVVDSWLPGRGVRPHDHGTWAIVVGVTGTERNVFWRREDDGSVPGHARLSPVRDVQIGPGDGVAMASGEIHSVTNETRETTLSFHVYGRHLNYTGRSQFDVEGEREIPFIIEMS